MSNQTCSPNAGYASVIFNHPVFQPHMNALAKLVLFSSMMHQIGFLFFSSLDFAIGTVQDAGLIFLSSMANTIADRMENEGESEEAIVSTTLALLSSGTALLGVILVIMGHFKLANAVSYLPMPVVGGVSYHPCWITNDATTYCSPMNKQLCVVSCIYRLLLLPSWSCPLHLEILGNRVGLGVPHRTTLSVTCHARPGCGTSVNMAFTQGHKPSGSAGGNGGNSSRLLSPNLYHRNWPRRSQRKQLGRPGGSACPSIGFDSTCGSFSCSLGPCGRYYLDLGRHDFCCLVCQLSRCCRYIHGYG